MMRKCIAAYGMILMLGAMLALASPPAVAQAQQAANPPYSLAEYNAYQAAAGQTNPQAKIQACDDFVAKFPKSVLIPLIDELYYNAYNLAKNYPKVIESVDQFMAIPDDSFTKLNITKEAILGKRLTALYYRALAFNQSFKETDPNAQDELTKARQDALQGLTMLGQLSKPANMNDDQFAQQKKPLIILFNYTAGSASYQTKDYKSAIDSFNAELAENPTDAATYFRTGVAYLQLAAKQAPQAPAAGGSAPPTPPAGAAADPAEQASDLYLNGFWDVARAIGLKGQGEAQMRSYLRAQMFNYEQPACGTLLDQQMDELVQLATNAPARPATYSIPSAADLGKVLQASNLISILGDLEAGGDKAKTTWLAACGQEIPNVVGKIIDVTPGAPDNSTVDIKVFTAATGEAIMAGTAANLDVTVAGQPDAATLEKGNQIKFTGTLAKYDAQPLLVYFDKGKVDPSSFPTEKKEKVPGKKKPGATERGRG
ncbi:MAG TPA: hypothetical protein VJN21_05830 [Candidatus Acidoferrales bacterium]|nr:hypothetical protein [Candidatus Acidoferrales bacterium]